MGSATMLKANAFGGAWLVKLSGRMACEINVDLHRSSETSAMNIYNLLDQNTHRPICTRGSAQLSPRSSVAVIS